ncbi:MAG: transcriptional repressor LexA, partial [Proteobacteria bacterium]|nr:transcriptional repressor LexA [Pseudomonadota bacterium]
KKVLDFIRDFASARGYAPSQQEIAGRFGFRSLGTVQNYLVRLEDQGLLRRSWNAKRAIEVVRSESRGAPALPLLGWVAAGQPIEAVTTDDRLEVPPSMVGRGEHFVLRVKGDSMVEDGILDRDYVVIRRQETAHNGQIVVAVVDGEATVKRFFRTDRSVELRPANSTMGPIVVGPGQDLQVKGVAAGLIRRWE